jgi:hypothetical protein
MPHQYLPETLALIEQAEREIAAEKAAATDTSAVDNGQLAGIFAHLQAQERYVRTPDNHVTPVDPQWAGPSLPHPTEATSEAEYDDLTEAWDNWAKGIDVNDLAEGHYTDEAGI